MIYLVVIEIATYLITDFGWFNFLNNYLLHIDMNFYNIGGTRYPHLKTCSGISEKKKKIFRFSKSLQKRKCHINKKTFYSCFYCDAIIKKNRRSWLVGENCFCWPENRRQDIFFDRLYAKNVNQLKFIFDKSLLYHKTYVSRLSIWNISEYLMQKKCLRCTVTVYHGLVD